MSKIENQRKDEIKAIIAKLSLEEKASLMLHESKSIDSVGIPEYNWWNECLHGVARSGYATVFPQAIGLGATFDTELAEKEAATISDEARAKYNQAIKAGVRTQYRGLTFWTPNVNIFRDPRWGRGQETYGEDPYLTSEMGKAFVKGLQGDDPDYLKTAACAKHYAVHSGPEKYRHVFNAVVSKKDLWETYLPAFRELVKAGVEAVMGAYNRTLGEPCCGSKFLLVDILKKKWGFRGHIVSDCWAVRDFHENHRVTKTPEESAALAINMGCDLNCGCTYHATVAAVKQGLLDEKKINESVERLLMTRFKLGMFDAPEKSPWNKLGAKDIDSAEHRALALKTAEESIVLLKNKNNLLPIKKGKKHVLVMGPAAADLHTLISNYYGLNSKLVSILEGITTATEDHPEITLDYTQGCMMYSPNLNKGWTVGMAENADIVIACFGLDNAMEGEEGDAIASDMGDRTKIELPEWQLEYLQAVHDRGTPVVLVITGGSAIAFPPDIADAILEVWYPGEEGGTATASILFGNTVPSGHLPLTFPKRTEDLPPFEDYSMQGRTYRYMKKEPLFPFGFGLSYTTFKFDAIKLSKETIKTGDTVTAEVKVTNTGIYDADEVVQIYLSKQDKRENDPICSLKAFKRVPIKAGKTELVKLELDSEKFETVTDEGENILLPGIYKVTAAESAPFEISEKLGSAEPVSTEIAIR